MRARGTVHCEILAQILLYTAQMTTPIEIREFPSRRLLAKKATCKHAEIGPTFGKSIHAVSECFRASGAKMTSMPMAIYLEWRESDCDLAAGCTVEGEVTLTGGCEWVEIPGGPHAFASHFGPYSSLHETHAAIQSWCAEHDAKPSGPCWESYPTDPGLEPDSSKWQTDVHYPVEPA
jgi:effector-binding domain-containing protein